MKANKLVKESGPFKVLSVSQDGEGVRLVVYPAHPRYNMTPKRQEANDIDESWGKDPRWAIHRMKGEGGGPGIFTNIALAGEMEAFLNQAYSPEQVAAWHQTVKEMEALLRKKRKHERREKRKCRASNCVQECCSFWDIQKRVCLRETKR